VTLVVAGSGAYTDLVEAPVEDVGSVATAVHPAPEGVARAGVPVGPPRDVLSVDAPVVTVALQPLPHGTVPQVVLLDHVRGVGASRLGELGVYAQGSKPPAPALPVVQAEGALFLGL
jgi:hypothetical protein